MRETQPSLDPRKLVFIDETWASTNMTPRYGRCEIGKRLIGYAPFGHWKTTTFVAALRHDGLTAPASSTDRSTERSSPLTSNRKWLDAEPRRHRDHGQPQRSQARRVKIAIEAAGAELRFLPPYSPDLDRSNRPSQVQKHLAQLARRTLEGLWSAAPSHRGDSALRLPKLLHPLRIRMWICMSGNALAPFATGSAGASTPWT